MVSFDQFVTSFTRHPFVLFVLVAITTASLVKQSPDSGGRVHWKPSDEFQPNNVRVQFSVNTLARKPSEARSLLTKARVRRKSPQISLKRSITASASTRSGFLAAISGGIIAEETVDSADAGNFYVTLPTPGFTISAQPSGGLFIIPSPTGTLGDRSASTNDSEDYLLLNAFVEQPTCIGAFVFATQADGTLAPSSAQLQIVATNTDNDALTVKVPSPTSLDGDSNFVSFCSTSVITSFQVTSLDNNYFATIDSIITKDTSSAESNGDPHITPFGRKEFSFTLPSARASLDVYNYITLPTFQQNCRFIKYTGFWNGEYVIETGMLIRDPVSKAPASSIVIGPIRSANNTGWSLQVRADGAIVGKKALAHKLFSVHQSSKSEVLVEFAMIRVRVFLRFARGLPFLDIKEDAVLLDLLRTAHGLVGQSARPEIPYQTPRRECFACFVHGTLEDYRIQSGDILGMDFNHNQFESDKE